MTRHLAGGRRYPLSRVRLPVCLAVLITVSAMPCAGSAMAKSVTLGKTNKSKSTTTLRSSSKKRAALAVSNSGGAPAATFSVKRNKTPFTVSSSAKVRNLNADLLDGLDSSRLQRQVGGGCAAGSAIRVINPDGSVTCQPVLTSTPPAPLPAWNLTGNDGTNPAVNFLGTTDAQPLVVRTNNVERLRITADGLVGVGTSTPAGRLQASATGAGETAMVGTSAAGDGISGTSTTGSGVTAAGAINGVFGVSDGGIGVRGDSIDRGVVGTLNGGSCPGSYGVGGCGGDSTGVEAISNNDGVLATSHHASGGNTAAAVRAINDNGGDIFIGQNNATHHVARIDSTGKGFFNGGTQTGGADYAESIGAVPGAQLHPGDVLAIDASHGYAVARSSRANSPLVVGVYSTRPAVLAVGSRQATGSLGGRVPVAMMGVVPTKVTAAGGAIRAGDLLTSSSLPGYAMRARSARVHGITIYPQGTIIGKALQSLRSGRGVIQVMLMSR